MFAFLFNYQPNPILLNLGFIQIRWYSIILMIALASGFFVFYRLVCGRGGFVTRPDKRTGNVSDTRTGHRPVPTDEIINLFFWTVVWAVIGGRLFHVLSFIDYYLARPFEIFYIWQGGISFYGIFLFGMATIAYWAKRLFLGKQGKNFQFPITNFKKWFMGLFFLFDAGVVALAIAQTIGRWGNWFNGELFGLPCNFAWCIPINLANRPLEYISATHFHPVFLYESILMLLVFILLFKIYKNIYSSTPLIISDRCVKNNIDRINNNETMKQFNNKKILYYTPGIIFSIYLIFHGIVRFLLEFLRLDPQPELFGLRLFQYFALVEFAAGLFLYFYLRKWYNKEVVNSETMKQ